SLGAIGVLTRLQLRPIDEPFFETIQKVVPLDEALKDLDRTSKNYDFWRIDWVPESEHGLLWAATRVPREKSDPKDACKPGKAANVLQFGFKMGDKVRGEAMGPLLDPAMNAVYKLMMVLYNLDQTRATGPLRTMLPVDRRVSLHVAMAEWSFAP